MITYKISDGSIAADGEYIGTGYSGNGMCLDNPDFTWVSNHGPIPVGQYVIEASVDLPESVGFFALPLTPDPSNDMKSRGGFYVHGDNPQMNQTASDGCIVASREIREIISQHSVLEVTP